MSSAVDWQPGVLSGRPELWSWRETWKPCGPSLGNSGQSSRTVAENGQGPSVNSASKTSDSASSWPRYNDPDPWRGGLVLSPDHRMAPLSVPPPQASRTEQELQRELDTLRGQCQTQTLAGAELRTRLESLQAEVVAVAAL